MEFPNQFQLQWFQAIVHVYVRLLTLTLSMTGSTLSKICDIRLSRVVGLVININPVKSDGEEVVLSIQLTVNPYQRSHIKIHLKD